MINYLADSIQRYEEYVDNSHHSNLSIFQDIHHRCQLFYQARTGSNLAYFYLFIKLLYILNLIFQILFLQYFLSYYDVNYIQYGFHILQKLFSDLTLPESKLFPRITLCDFQIRELAERHKYTVECILVINIFIEKIYFILWIWFAVLLFMTLFDICYFIYKIFPRHSRNAFLAKYLDLIPTSYITKEKQYHYYRSKFPVDNVFALWIISVNSNSFIVAEVLNELFRRKLYPNPDA